MISLKQKWIFGLPFSILTFVDLLENIEIAVANGSKILCISTNLHTLRVFSKLTATRNKLLRCRPLFFSDGQILTYVCMLFGYKKLVKRISGTDLVEQLLLKKYRVFVICSDNEILHKLKIRFSNSHISGWVAPYNDNWYKLQPPFLSEQRFLNADIIMVGVSSPKQEIWLANWFSETNARVGLSVGSAFEILTGKKKRAPIYMQKAGLEWLWRMMLEPKRLLVRYIMDACYLLINLTALKNLDNASKE